MLLPVQPGQIIAEKYRVDDVLGEGGMGLVVSAFHLGLEQRVAIKLLLRDVLEHDESALGRFEREARAAARLQSDHVCRVIDTGKLQDGTPFLVMEHLEGVDLANELYTRGSLEPAEAVRFIRQACDAIGEAHRVGVIHRDLKPANLFLVPRPGNKRMVKVLDFGISKTVGPAGREELSLTKTSTLVGSPLYMSPEQLRSSKDVDARTDIWSLGVILYEAITGRLPFDGETMPQLVHAVLDTRPPRLAELGLNVPDGLQDVLDRAIAKDRDERYPTAEEFSLALSHFAPDPLITSPSMAASATGIAPAPPRKEPRASGISGHSGTGRATPVGSGAGAPTPASSRRTAGWVAAALLLLGLGGAAAWWLVTSRSSTQAGTEGTSRSADGAPGVSASEQSASPPVRAAGADRPDDDAVLNAAPVAPRPGSAEGVDEDVDEGQPEPTSASAADELEQDGIGSAAATVEPEREDGRSEPAPAQAAAPDQKSEPRRRRSRTRRARERAPVTAPEPARAAPNSGDDLPDFGGRR